MVFGRENSKQKTKSINNDCNEPSNDYKRLDESYESCESQISRGASRGRRSASNSPSKPTRKGLHKQRSTASTSSFSQSDEFKTIFDDDGKSPNSNKKLSDDDQSEATEVYFVRQRYGYLSMLFSFVQCGILALMMNSCGVAPLNINPMIGPYPDALSEWGGKNAINILEDGEWWRLVTPILLHAGVIHLLCNVAVQVETGAFFEREWGSHNWLIIYLTSAVGSSILSVIVMPDAVSVGSSGAVMGLFGGKLAEVTCRVCESDKSDQGKIGHQVRKEQCAAATCSVIVVMLFSFIPYVDWAAHLGGLVAGYLVGILVFSLFIKTLIWRFIWFIVGAGITVIYFTVALGRMYNGDIEVAEELRDVCGYYKEYFDDYECNCMRDQQENA